MKNKAGKWLRIGITGIVLLVLVIWYSVGTGRDSETVRLGQSVLGARAGEIGTGEIGTGERGAEKIGEADETAGAETAGRIFIHVCGEVVSPGVYELNEGSRLYQAVDAAGGLTEEADGDFLNQAQVLTDGMQLRIPDRREAEELRRAGYDSAGSLTAEGGSSLQDGRVNLNTATKEQLMTLSGIGEARAEAILAYRREAGGFKTVEDIMKVSGIKEAAFQKIKEDITV